jgi:hypothetical protein
VPTGFSWAEILDVIVRGPLSVHHPRLDRRGAAQAEDVLHGLRGGEDARLAARRAGDLSLYD